MWTKSAYRRQNRYSNVDIGLDQALPKNENHFKETAEISD